MASFTDQISQFNPYIAQLPVDTMAQVGQWKQAKYDQGVQKIQTQIDNVAGIDIANDTQKKYLQSKLDELGNNLRTVAAGDFSNQQLVNSVGGMATSIVKDPVIQNAMYSTQRVRSETATAQNLYREGKSSISNVEYLNNQVGQYLTSKDVNASFNGKYINYVDLNKKWQDLADNLKKSAPDNSIDNPYKTDANNKTLYYIKDKNGNVISSSTDARSGGVPELDDAMKRISIKGVSAQSLYDSMNTSLTPDDLEQMKVDAWYHYRGQGPESVIQDLTASNTLAKNMLEQQIGKLKVDMLTSPNLSTDDKLAMQANIAKYQTKLTDGSFEKDLNNQIVALQDPKNLENAHYVSYRQKILNEKAAELANQSVKEEILANPYVAVNMQRATLQETVRYHNIEHTDRQNQLIYSYAALAEKRWKDQADLDWKTKDWKDQHRDIVTENRAITTNITAPTLDSVETKIKSAFDNKDKLNAEAAVNFKFKPGPIDKVTGKPTYPELDDLYNKYKKDPRSVTNRDAIDYVTAREAAERDIVRQNNIKQIVNEGSKTFDNQIQTTLKDWGGVTDVNGKEIVSAPDLYDVHKTISRYTTVSGGERPTVNVNVDAILQSVGSNPSKRAIAMALIKKATGQSATPTEVVIANRATEIGVKMSSKLDAINKAKYDYQSKTIAKYDPYYQEQVGTLNPKNTGDMASLDNLIGNTIDTYNTQGGLDLPKGSNYNPDTLAKMRSTGGSAKEDVTTSIVKKPDGSALVILNQGTTSQTIPVSAENFAKYYPDYAKTNPFNEDFHATLASPNRTTNTGGGAGDQSADALTAAHTGYEIPLLNGTSYQNLVRYDVVGKKGNDGHASTDKYFLRLFVNKKGTWIPVESEGGYVDGPALQNYVESGIGPSTIEKILKTSK